MRLRDRTLCTFKVGSAESGIGPTKLWKDANARKFGVVQIDGCTRIVVNERRDGVPSFLEYLGLEAAPRATDDNVEPSQKLAPVLDVYRASERVKRAIVGRAKQRAAKKAAPRGPGGAAPRTPATVA